MTEKRFEPNRDLLSAQHGVAATRLSSFGASFSAPVAIDADEAGCAKNRRVELVAF